MTAVVLDASALLCLLLGEPGADAVLARLPAAALSAVNYAETLGRAARLCGSLADAKRQVDRYDLPVLPFDAAHAAVAAALLPATAPLGLSLGDRACLAAGLALGRPVLTADRAWAGLDVGVRVEVVR